MRSTARMSLIVLFACGGDLPEPAYVGQPTDALAPVEYPPPPARAEFVPKRPPGGPVWIDGEWVWQGRRWAWRTGRWVVPPVGARFSPWTMVRSDDGTIYYAGGVWRDDQNRKVADPVAMASAKATFGQIEDPEGQPEQTGHNIHDSRAPESPEGGAAIDAGTDGRGD
jgi:hypothetical protein